MDYLDFIRSCRIRLSRQEEARLVKQMRAGDLAARDRLIESVLPWIVKLARPFLNRAPLEDLVQAGIVGLLEYLPRFNPRKARLTTYTTAPALWRMSNVATEADSILSRPVNPPAEHLLPAWNAQADPLDIRADRPCDPDLPDLDGQEQRQRLQAAIDGLPLREKWIIQGRLAGQRLVDVGAAEGIGRERARQIEQRAIGRLRKAMVAA
jgi:RNA polymerase sigma factor (sigma-70 family)